MDQYDIPEDFKDIAFPLGGLDQSLGYGEQLIRPGEDKRPMETCRAGVNVRAFEPMTQRQRGGSRAGLKKWPTPQVPTAGFIQNLCVVPYTSIMALLDSFEPIPGPTDVMITDPSSPGPASTWGYDLDADTGTIFPRNSRVPINPPRKLRTGGTYRQFAHNRLVQSRFQFVQAVAGEGMSLAFNGMVTQGNLIVVVTNNVLTTSGAISDTLGNTYANVASVAAFGACQMWVATSVASGGNTVTPGSWIANGSIAVLEYATPYGSSALDGTHTNNVGAPTTALTTGTVTVGNLGELLIGAFFQSSVNGMSVTPGSVFTTRATMTNTLAGDTALYVMDNIKTSASAPVTGTAGSAVAYAALGASFAST